MPADTPVTNPVNDPIVAAAVLLIHLPPGVASANIVEVPIHTEGVPVIGLRGFTVILILV